jgi:thioredoxin-related protein
MKTKTNLRTISFHLFIRQFFLTLRIQNISLNFYSLALGKLLCILFLSLTSRMSFAQTMDTIAGIKWTTDLSWEQVKQKAKEENKYIFLDCFATWCGPCKKMEKSVFIKKNLGDFVNDKFISVRVQIDSTQKDNESVRKWYSDAAFISKTYKVNVLPTFLFFKPDGNIVYRERGFKGGVSLLQIAKLAATPGRKYEDPYKEYDSFVEAYYNGTMNYQQMPSLIEKAKEFADWPLARLLTQDYFKYLQGNNKTNWYTKTNVTFLANNISDSKNEFFQMFFPNGKKVDDLMGKKEYSRYVVDRVINAETVEPFLLKYLSQINTTMIKSGLEPNWDSLRQVIADKYHNDFAERAVRRGKSGFYWRTQFISSNNKAAYTRIQIEMIEKQEIDPSSQEFDLAINGTAWDIFEASTDEREIKMAIQWMKDLVSRDNAYRRARYFTWDTYANLLYKASLLFNNGQLSEAIDWEKKALEEAVNRDAPEDRAQNYKQVIDKMNRREPTWDTVLLK